MPLPFHKFAQLAAEASLAANAQGKFWEYHDLLFANQKALERPSLESYAQQLGLDMEKFRAALDSHQFAAAIDQDKAVAQKVGATGTPASYINGVKVSGAQPFPAFQAAIDKALAGGAAPARDVAPARLDGVGLGATVEGLKADGAALGPEGAKDTVVVFVDLGGKESLPALAGLLALQEKHSDSLRLVLRHAAGPRSRRPSPIGQMLAAAMGQDGPKAWRALAALAKAGDPSLREITSGLQKAGLDPAALRTAMRDAAVLAQLESDVAEAAKAKIVSAPAAVINGRVYLGGKGWTAEALEGLLAASHGR